MPRSQAEFRLHAKICEVAQYDPATGLLTWKVGDRARRVAGKEIGFTTSSGYRRGTICGRTDYVHRWAWFISFGEWPAAGVDHVDGDRSNNRLSNLRDADHGLNAANTGLRKDNRSGFKGVAWHARAKKWVASIRVNGKTLYLGLYLEASAAAEAYDSAALRHFGAFARTNGALANA